MTAGEIVALSAAVVPAGGVGWLIRRLWRDLRETRRELAVERAARLTASEECDKRLEARVSVVQARADEFEAKFNGATARMQGRIDALEKVRDEYVEKRVAEQKATLDFLGKLADRNSDVIEANTEALAKVLAAIPPRAA